MTDGGVATFYRIPPLPSVPHPVSVPLRPRTLNAIAAALLTLASGGCAPVRPWQRGRLASPAMAVPLADAPVAVGYRAKLLESRMGGGVPGIAAGGGCGCTQ